ncbi:hypothetical protein CCUS01_09302 [Colletotrichum cuscutae]|uniref:HNH nuclease domain-containing protein n=1 Tax=Colletotrichum cuscutae TaxID=1209917 RepID=A0AAI9XSW3_9PEZI|nr:hypothetical protein CCUS01_09302 [Colletotrichum cuscutae]
MPPPTTAERNTLIHKFCENFSQQKGSETQRLEFAIIDQLLDSFQTSTMTHENLEEIKDFHSSQWTPTYHELSYLEDTERRLAVLEEIKRMTYLDGNTTTSLSDTLHTPYLWAACMSTDLSELENFRDILKESSMEDAGPSLMLITTAVQQLVALDKTPDHIEVDSTASSPSAKSPRREPATRSPRSTPSKSNNSPRPLLSPLQNSPGKEGSVRRQQSAQSGSPSSPGNQKKYRNKRAVQMAKQRDNGTCPLLGTRYCEAAHIYPFASIEKRDSIVTSVHALIKVFGRVTARRFTDALRTVNLDSCANLICLDRIPHRMYDDGRLALRPIERGTHPDGKHFIRLRLYLLQNTKLRRQKLRTEGNKRKQEDTSTKPYRESAWANNLAQDPREILEPFLDDFTEGQNLKVRLVSSETQRVIRNGHVFEYTATSEDLLPNWDILDLMYRISLMGHLVGAAGVSDKGMDDSDEDLSETEIEELDIGESVITESQRAHQSDNRISREG